MPPKQIIITGDILRVCPISKKPNQTINIIWFEKLIGFYIKASFPDVPIKTITDGKEHGFSLPIDIYKAEQLLPSIESWGKIYNRENLTSSTVDLLETIFSESVIIGFELPNILKTFFTHKHIPYFDFSLHSIRFADDLLFNLESNVESSQATTKPYFVGSELFSALAACHLATLSRIKPPTLNENSCLVVGQTEYDKSVIEKDHFVTIFHYENQVHDLINKYSTVYYKPHPYCADTALTKNIAEHFGLSIIEDNIYKYLGCKDIVSVAAISSSVVHEARYFNKDSSTFNPEQTFQDRALSPVFLSTGFWESLLGDFFRITPGTSFTLPVIPSRLRRSIGSYWGYNYLEFQIIEEELRNIPKSNLAKFTSRLPISWRQKISSMLPW